MKFPTPGQPVRGSRSGAPIMALFDLLGRHWAMGVVWNLHEGACTFREIQSRCETVSPTVLNKRLAELRAAGLIERTDEGYALTTDGERLYAMLVPLGAWSKAWARRVQKAAGGS
jgi:DNA-binding HxlR family transcriptional regulator